jgi:hypothetical protein
MALFFDARWFDARLAQLGLTRADAGRVLGLAPQELADMWKDQREVLPREVALLAALLDAPQAEIASRAGIATRLAPDGPTAISPDPDAQAQRITQLEARVTALEARVRALSAGS